MKTKIMGFDPGLATLGFGLIATDGYKHSLLDAGVIVTPPKTSLPKRLAIIQKEVNQLLKSAKADVFSVEKIFFNTNTTNAIDVSQARGVLLAALEAFGAPIFEYTPLQIKMSISGFGRADKRQMQAMVKSLLGLKTTPRPDDCADALAAALTHAHSANFKQE